MFGMTAHHLIILTTRQHRSCHTTNLARRERVLAWYAIHLFSHACSHLRLIAWIALLLDVRHRPCLLTLFCQDLRGVLFDQLVLRRCSGDPTLFAMICSISITDV